jgi:hypothetical protein
MRPDRTDMLRPAVDQRDLAAGSGESGADVGPDRSGTDHGDAHRLAPPCIPIVPRRRRHRKDDAAIEQPLAD